MDIACIQYRQGGEEAAVPNNMLLLVEKSRNWGRVWQLLESHLLTPALAESWTLYLRGGDGTMMCSLYLAVKKN